MAECSQMGFTIVLSKDLFLIILKMCDNNSNSTTYSVTKFNKIISNEQIYYNGS